MESLTATYNVWKSGLTKILVIKSLVNKFIGQKVIILQLQIWLALIWQIVDDSPNSPNITAISLSTIVLNSRDR